MPSLVRLFPFLAWRRRVDAATLRADLVAGFVGALVVLPQAVAYATLAGLPAAWGLYASMVPVVVAALWGSSWHQMSGPTNTVSLAVFAMLAPMATPGSDDYLRYALTLALLVGAVQLAMGLARLGWLVNFISHTVIVAFTAGAGLLIVAAQLRAFFGVAAEPAPDFFTNVLRFVRAAGSADPWATATGLVTVGATLAARRLLPRIPHMIAGLVAGSAFGALAVRAGARLAMVGELPGGLPPITVPSFDLATWQALAPAAIALTALTLAQSVSVARAVATKSGQRLDGNQEFIGQGLSNLAGAFTGSYVSSGSFNRIWVNYDAGARTPLAAVFSALILAAIVVAVAPLGRHLPLAVMAGLLFVVAFGLVDVRQMRRIAHTNAGDAWVLAVTFLGTIALPLEFAILGGVLASLVVYLHRTTHPRVTRLAPDRTSGRRLVPVAPGAIAPERCPQLAVVRIEGSLFFGAAEHVRDEFEAIRKGSPPGTQILLVASNVNFADVAGAALLAQEAAATREAGGALWVAELKDDVAELLDRAGTLDALGRDRVFETREDAIEAIYPRLSSAVCAACTVRAFAPCADALPDGSRREGAQAPGAAR